MVQDWHGHVGKMNNFKGFLKWEIKFSKWDFKFLANRVTTNCRNAPRHKILYIFPVGANFYPIQIEANKN